jgi:hypothetical protein
LDNDGDHHGRSNVVLGFGQPVYSCTRPGDKWFLLSELISKDDCNDNDPAINPETVWVLDNDHDGYYVTSVTQCDIVRTRPGYVVKTSQQPGDCNDDDASINRQRFGISIPI